MEPREITVEYIQLFISTIRKGGPVTFVEKDNLLAVTHPTKGYLVLQLADEVVDTKESKNV